MSDDEPDRQRLEDMLEVSAPAPRAGDGAGEAPRDGAPSTNGTAPASDGGSDAPAASDASAHKPARPDGAGHERPARASGSAATMVKAGLICGGLSIPAAMIPFAGMLLGIAAIVLGVKVSRVTADGRAKIAIGLGAAGLVLSLVLFALALASA